MNSKSALILSLALSLSHFSSFAAAEADVLPTSEIPAKREFPVDEKVNPCQDFHKYACGKAEAAFKLREDRSAHAFAFSDSHERILKLKIDFFKNIDNEKKLSKRAMQVKNFYKACMDEKAGATSETKAIADFQESLSKVQTAAQFSQWSFERMKQGRHSLFGFWTESNKDNPNIYDMSVSANYMLLPQFSYYDNKDLMKDYRQLMVDLFKIIEPKTSESALAERVDKVFALEKEYVAIYPHPEVLRQRWSENRQMSQEKFKEAYGGLGYEAITKMAPKKLAMNVPIPESLDFFKKNLSDANLQAFKDFATYAALNMVFDDSNPEFFKKGFEFRKKYLGGPAERSVREERCTRSTMNSFNLEIDQVLIPRMFPHFPNAKIKEVASKIRQSILAGIDQNTWLSASAKKEAHRKTDKARLFLIQPQNEREWDFIPVRTYSATDKIANEQLFRKTSFEKNMADLKKPVNLVAWGMSPLTVNAYYDPSANKFVLPIGILQYPFFNADGDVTENLGAVGAVIGHELGHGIDDQGAKYDADGKLKQWMSMDELAEFSKRSEKMVAQFNKAGHNGQLTLGENIADLVGMGFAYHAAFPNGKGSVEDKKKFFTAYAHLWCFVARPKAIESQLKTNPHALGWARINEQVKHQSAFAEVYQCKAGDPMTLPDSEKVKIW